MSDSLQPHELQCSRPLCPSPTPGIYPNSCPLSQWHHPTISSSVVPFFSCPQSFSASGCFQMSQLFTAGGQSTGVSASASVLPMNTQDWSTLGWTGWISKGIQGTLKSLLQHHSSKPSILQCSAFFIVQLSHAYMTTGKIASLVLLKEKIGFLDISSVQSYYTKAVYVATLFCQAFTFRIINYNQNQLSEAL